MWSLDTKIETEEEFVTIERPEDSGLRQIIQQKLKKKREYLKKLKPNEVTVDEIKNLIMKFRLLIKNEKSYEAGKKKHEMSVEMEESYRTENNLLH